MFLSTYVNFFLTKLEISQQQQSKNLPKNQKIYKLKMTLEMVDKENKLPKASIFQLIQTWAAHSGLS